jgi:hypothetical protein
MNLKILLACGILLAGALPSHAVTGIESTPQSDGELIDNDCDGMVDYTVLPKFKNKIGYSVHVGKNWGRNYKAIFEFKLPDSAKPVTKARLRLAFHGTYGCWPQKPGSHGPETETYYYLSPEADGKVQLTDDAGTLIGTTIEAKPIGKNQYIYIDVTKAVMEAIAQKSAYIGFKFQASAQSPTGRHWDFKAREFADSQKAPFIGPCLIIYDK